VKSLITLALLILMVPLSTEVSAETRYVSDELTIFMRSGPTKEYRIIGTLQSGQAVEVLSESEANNATQIRLASGREAWVDSNQLIARKPLGLQLSELQLAYQKLESDSRKQISTLQQELEAARTLAGQSQELQQQVTQLEYDKELLEQKNQTLSQRSRYDLLTAGGVVALIGVLLGLIIPKLVRRRRNDVWR
jgi:SH3 domain protein